MSLLPAPAICSLVTKYSPDTAGHSPRPIPSPTTTSTASVGSEAGSLPPTPTDNAKTSSPRMAEQKAYRDKGYPAFCEFIASSPDFMVLRRFNNLNARVLLSMQDDIVLEEDRLLELDEECRNGSASIDSSSSIRIDEDPRPERVEILRRLRQMLKDYNEYIIAYSDIRDRSSARDSQIRNYQNWFRSNAGAIDKPERKFVEHGTDVIALVPRPKSWSRLAVEKLGPFFLGWLFKPKPKPGRSTDENLRYVSNQGIDATLTVVIVSTGLGMLLGPMWWLDGVTDPQNRLKIITAFIIVFTVLLAGATVRRPFEVLIGTAGYAAVLMVYFQTSAPNHHSAHPVPS